MMNHRGHIWYFYAVLLSQLSVGIIDAVHKLSYQLNNTYLNKIFYGSKNTITPKEQMLSIMFHELGAHGIRIVMCLIFAIVFYFLGNEISYLSIPFAGVIIAIPLMFMIEKD